MNLKFNNLTFNLTFSKDKTPESAGLTLKNQENQVVLRQIRADEIEFPLFLGWKEKVLLMVACTVHSYKCFT